jgi:aminoglycoside phosphotransferase family enzyme
VIDDIAFLFMDLMSHERPDLALTLLSRYLEITGDYDGPSPSSGTVRDPAYEAASKRKH